MTLKHLEPESAVKVIHPRECISVFHCLQVQFPVVNTETHLAVLLRDYSEWGGEWRLTFTDHPSVKKLL